MSAHDRPGPQVRMLPDGRRLHLQHGPIDLVIEAFGQQNEVEAAYAQAVSVFDTVLIKLVEEMHLLRQPWHEQALPPNGEVARRMYRVAGLHGANIFVTPMIAVAGAVADHVLEALIAGRDLNRAYVNNGGDIALHIDGTQVFDVGVCSNPQTGEQASMVRLCKADCIAGVATSGWRGRSHSMGIADAVTVLAQDAASADAAATLIANAVNIPRSPKIKRAPAKDLSPDSDLGERPVTVEVKCLQKFEIEQALDNGHRVASKMIESGLVRAVFLALQGSTRSLENTADKRCLKITTETRSNEKLEAEYA